MDNEKRVAGGRKGGKGGSCQKKGGERGKGDKEGGGEREGKRGEMETRGRDCNRQLVLQFNWDRAL